MLHNPQVHAEIILKELHVFEENDGFVECFWKNRKLAKIT